MASISSSATSRKRSARVAARGALEALLAGTAAALAAALIWRQPGQREAVALGLGTAWLASSVSTAALIFAKARSAKAFWWAFGGGMALRFAVLGVLAFYSVKAPELSQPGLLLSYALGVLAFLLLEYRHIEIK